MNRDISEFQVFDISIPIKFLFLSLQHKNLWIYIGYHDAFAVNPSFPRHYNNYGIFSSNL